MSTRSRRGATALLIAAALAGLAGCAQAGASGPTPTATAANPTPTASTVPPREVETETAAPLEPLPSVETDGEATCDYILGDRDEFVAVAYLINTGDAPGSAKVTATWKQANGRHIRRSQTVSVPVGTPVEVYLSATASTSQISLHQALPLGKRCSIDVDVTG